MSVVRRPALPEAQEMKEEVLARVQHLSAIAIYGAQNVTLEADFGGLPWDAKRITRHEVEGALRDVQEILGELLPCLPD